MYPNPTDLFAHRRHSSLVLFGLILAGATALGSSVAESAPAPASGGPGLNISDYKEVEGLNGATKFTFTVTLDPPSSSTVFVDFATKDGSATEFNNNDYVGNNGQLQFDPGENEKFISIDVNGDDIQEGDEEFYVNLSSASGGGAFIQDGQGTGTIQNDDGIPDLIIDDGSNSEGSFLPFVPFRVSLSHPTDQDVTVTYLTKNGTAEDKTGNADYEAASGQATIPAKQLSTSILVNLNRDDIYERDENFFVNLSDASGANLLDAQATGTILNDDPFPTASIGPIGLVEGNDGKTEFLFTVTLSNPWGPGTGNLLVSTQDGTATLDNGDYQQFNRIVDVPAKQASVTIPVQVNGDVTYESDETFRLVVNVNRRITPTSGNIESTAFGDATIQNDDDPPTVNIEDVSQVEGDAGKTDFVFTASLSNLTDQYVLVSYLTKNGSATLADGDYQAATNSFLIEPKQPSATFTVSVNGDQTVEFDETFLVNYSAAFFLGASLGVGDGMATGTILNDDAIVSIDDVSLPEGNVNKSPFAFTVSLSTPVSHDVTVDYDLKDDSATLGNNDYQGPTSGQVTIPANTQSTTLTVMVNGDNIDEGDEQFFVNLTSAQGATIGDGQGTGTITDDDALPTVSIDNVSQDEGSESKTAFMFTATLSNAIDEPVDVTYSLKDGNATVANGDYQDEGQQTVTIPAKELSTTFIVSVNGDLTFEEREFFLVNYSASTSGFGLLNEGQATGTILNDDARPTVSINDVSRAEDEGSAGKTDFVFTVSLTNPIDVAVVADYVTKDGSATQANSDYQAATGVVTIPPKQTSATITVSVNEDVLFENDETFFVNILTPSNAFLGDGEGQGTIVNDDGLPTVSIDNVTDAESGAGQVAFEFTVRLSALTGKPVTVNYATKDGTATTDNGDYKATSGQATILAKSLSTTITVMVNGDNFYEDFEQFFVNLSDPVNATIGDGEGVGTIGNDDTAPAISINDVTNAEGNSSTTPFQFTVSLSNATDQPVIVDYATADGSATIGNNDYQTATGQVTIPPKTLSATITILGNGDTAAESDEDFFVNLTLASGSAPATFADAQGKGTIKNDDVAAPPDCPNLVKNPSFEKDKDGWSSYQAYSLSRVTGGIHGTYALQVKGRDSRDLFGITDSPDVVGSTPGIGTGYRFSAFLRSVSHTGLARLRIREYRGSTLVQTVLSPLMALSPAWTEHFVEVVTVRSGSRLDFQILDWTPRVRKEVFLVDSIRVVRTNCEPPPPPDQAPVVTAPAKVSASEEEKLVFVVTAQDPDGDVITSFTASGLPYGATFTTNSTKTSGTLNWTPDDDDGRSEAYVVTFTAKNALTGSASTTININDNSPPPPSGGTELCGNPGFESSLTGWKAYHGTSLSRVSPGRNGSSYALESRGGSDGDCGVNDYPNWVTSTQGGKTYRFSAWVRSASHTGLAQIKVREYQGSSSIRSTKSPALRLSPSWQELVVNVVAQASGTTLDLQIYDISAGQTFQIDDVSIKLVTPGPGLGPSLAVGLPTELEASLAPNPSRGEATLVLALPAPASVQAQLFDVGGRVVRTLGAGAEYPAGVHRLSLGGVRAGEPLRSGLYFYRVVAGTEVRRGRLVVVQ